MAKKTVRIGDVNVTLKTFKTNLFVLKEIGADVRMIPVDKRLRMLWMAANGFMSTPFFINPKQAEKELRKRLGEPSIDLSARYFGRPDGVPGSVEMESIPQERHCDKFFCRTRHRAFGFLVKIKDNGAVSGSPNALLELSRVTAVARVRLNGRSERLVVN